MRRIAPFMFIAAAGLITYFTLVGDNSYSQLTALRRSLEAQKKENDQTRVKISELRKEIYDLKNDDRALERAARNELGLARQGELIFIFESFVDVDGQ